jgi:DNA-binding MarR family transcriptional regulator
VSNRSKTELIAEIADRLRAMQVETDLFDDAAAERLGVNRTDLRVMDLLERLGPLTPSRLADLNHLSRPAITTVIDRLERAGYARRAADSSDRRQLLVEITPAARRRAMEIYGPFAERSRREFDGYTANELGTISRFLERAIELTREQLERIRPDGSSSTVRELLP